MKLVHLWLTFELSRGMNICHVRRILMLGSMSRSRKDTNATQRYYCHQIRHYQYYFKKLRVGLKEFKKSYDLQRSVDATIATTVSVMKIAMISLWLANVRI